MGFLEVGKDLLQLLFASGKFGMGLLELLLLELAFGDVTPDPDESNHHAIVVPQWHFRGGVPSMISKSIQHWLLPVQHRMAGAEQVLIVFRILFGHFCREEIMRGLAKDLFWCVGP